MQVKSVGSTPVPLQRVPSGGGNSYKRSTREKQQLKMNSVATRVSCGKEQIAPLLSSGLVSWGVGTGTWLSRRGFSSGHAGKSTKKKWTNKRSYTNRRTNGQKHVLVNQPARKWNAMKRQLKPLAKRMQNSSQHCCMLLHDVGVKFDFGEACVQHRNQTYAQHVASVWPGLKVLVPSFFISSPWPRQRANEQSWESFCYESARGPASLVEWLGTGHLTWQLAKQPTVCIIASLFSSSPLLDMTLMGRPVCRCSSLTWSAKT